MVTPMEDEPELARVALRQVYIRPGDLKERPRRHRPEIRHLNEGARMDVRAMLKQAGATRIGTRLELGLSSGKSDRARNLWVAVFPADHRAVPLVTYLLTRVLPAYYQYCPEYKQTSMRLL